MALSNGRDVRSQARRRPRLKANKAPLVRLSANLFTVVVLLSLGVMAASSKDRGMMLGDCFQVTVEAIPKIPGKPPTPFRKGTSLEPNEYKMLNRAIDLIREWESLAELSGTNGASDMSSSVLGGMKGNICREHDDTAVNMKNALGLVVATTFPGSYRDDQSDPHTLYVGAGPKAIHIHPSLFNFAEKDSGDPEDAKNGFSTRGVVALALVLMHESHHVGRITKENYLNLVVMEADAYAWCYAQLVRLRQKLNSDLDATRKERAGREAKDKELRQERVVEIELLVIDNYIKACLQAMVYYGTSAK